MLPQTVSLCVRGLRKQRLCGTFDGPCFERFEETQCFIDPFWVKQPHGGTRVQKPNLVNKNHWRRILNALVDEKVGKRANQERNLTLEVGIKAKDAVARQINKLLAEKGASPSELRQRPGPAGKVGRKAWKT